MRFPKTLVSLMYMSLLSFGLIHCKPLPNPLPEPAPVVDIISLVFAITATVSMASELELLNGLKSFCRRLTGGRVSCVQQVRSAIEALEEAGTHLDEGEITRLARLARQSDAALEEAAKSRSWFSKKPSSSKVPVVAGPEPPKTSPLVKAGSPNEMEEKVAVASGSRDTIETLQASSIPNPQAGSRFDIQNTNPALWQKKIQ